VRILIVLLAAFTWLALYPLGAASAADPPDTAPSCPDLYPQAALSLPASLLPEPVDCPAPGMVSSDQITHLLTPDLRTLPPYNLAIETQPDGSRALRLSNTIWNGGTGPLELEGALNSVTQQTSVVQHIYLPGGGRFTRKVGEFIFHPTHDHWHFEDYSIYELWTLTLDGALGAMLRSSDKISYCLIDTDVVDVAIEGFTPHKRYQGCGQALQGQSIGWGDTYKSHLDGQSIPLTGVADGFYALKSTANPKQILVESNYYNNSALIFLELRGDQVMVIYLADYIALRCQGSDGQAPGMACWE
jgi:hypothetical protein